MRRRRRAPNALAEGDRFSLDDTVLGGSVDVRCTPPANMLTRPYRTLSQSEEGFEKIMQTITLTLSWPLDGAATEIGVVLAIAPGNV